MNRSTLASKALALTLALSVAIPYAATARSSSEAVAQTKTPEPSPNQIVEQASAKEWTQIPVEDLLVMTLAPDSEGNPREVVIQLMPAPFSQGWVENIRTFARAKLYDGISVNRVQDNYVVQWGDPNYDNPEADGEAKPLPEGLKMIGEDDYKVEPYHDSNTVLFGVNGPADHYADWATHQKGWPIAGNSEGWSWPVHCYGMVGVGRNYSPDTGSGAELYTVIGHAPRHLDRNIALVGRIISGMKHLSSLPRGNGVLGFYSEDELDKRTPILSVRVAADLPQSEQPNYEYLSTQCETFARYADARANRRDPFFIHPAGGVDICNIPVPVRQTSD